MSARITAVPLIYFGKLPSRGDFVRSNTGAGLIQMLDRWLSQAMELLVADLRWKLVYDEASPMHFAVLGSRSPMGLAGYLMASQDSSGRRFPFVTGGSFETPQPLEFIARSPLALSRLWARLERTAQQARAAGDFADVQGHLQQGTLELESSPAAYEAQFRDFAEMQTVSSLESLLSQSGFDISMRQSLLALGMLLRPLLVQGSGRLEKGLALPLASDPLYRPLVAAFWLDLIVPFVARSDVELAIFVTAGVVQRPMLLLGFAGASPHTLLSAFDPQVREREHVWLPAAEWVEAYVDADYGVRKLSTYLREPQMSIAQATATFREVFLGA